MDICLERILELCKEKNISNAYLVKQLGVAHSSVSEWHKGKISSYRKHIAEIATLLDVSADYLLGKTNIRNTDEWNEFVENYNKVDEDTRNLVNRLLSVECDKGRPKNIPPENREDLSAVLELVKVFDQLNILKKTKVLSAAMELLNNNR